MKYILGIQPDIHHFHTDSDQKMTNLSMNEIKLKQYVLIAKAGLAVVESKERGMNSIEDYLLVQFTEAVKASSLPPNFQQGNQHSQQPLKTILNSLLLLPNVRKVGKVHEIAA